MATLAGVFAASHMPPMVNAPHAIPPELFAEASAAYATLGERLRAAHPDVLVIVAPDHFQNFFIDNLPAFCVGLGDEHGGPVEPWMKGAPASFAGHPALGAHVLQALYDADFEPALSYRLRLDHGYALPLRFTAFTPPAIVPIVVNNVQAPMPSVRRCHALGRVPTMGRIDRAFDAGFLERMRAPDSAALCAYMTAHIDAAGNGAQEMRNWVVARGAAADAPLEIIFYRAIPQWFTGMCIGAWPVREEHRS
jgi:hypothetical protein